MAHPRDRIDELQDEIREARSAGDQAREIECLIEIAGCAKALDDFGLQNMHLDIASREIRRTGCCLDRLHQVLGDRARLLRRAERYDQALALYVQAAEAAKASGLASAEACWVGKQGHIHRLEQRWDDAEACYRRARAMFVALGVDGLSGTADQEGNLGVLAQALGRSRETLRHYRRAVELAERARDAEMIGTWTSNYANELTRRRFYQRAREAHARAYASAEEAGDEARLRAVAMDWSRCHARAHRHDLSADLLLETAARLTQPRLILSVLRYALIDLQILDQRPRMLEVLAKVDHLTTDLDLPEEAFAPFRAYIEHNQHLDAEPPAPAGDADDEPTVLELYVIENMAAAQKRHDVGRMKDVAELVCDVNCGLANPSDDDWGRYLKDPALRYRVIADAVRALACAERTDESLDLSQRFKGAGFRVAALQALRKQLEHTQQEAAYLAAQERLERTIPKLTQRRVVRPLSMINDVRAAGEALREASALLKETDRILDARLGGEVRPEELLDAMPVRDGVAVCDFVTSYHGTMTHVLLRTGDTVDVYCLSFESFKWKECTKVLKRLLESGFNFEISARQREALLHMGETLHDYLMCELAKFVRSRQVAQFVLVPDALLQPLPLGLALVCGAELQVPDVTRGDERFFAEVFPLEYASCLQAVAVSQHKKRPRQVTKIVSASDPKLDLPGAFYAGRQLRESQGNAPGFVALAREEATLDRFLQEAADADVIILSAHGEFKAADPLASRLLLHDRDWRLGDMLRQAPFRRSPVVILNACEVGAVNPGSDAAISGMPGALISAGAACVIASAWPLIDLAAGYLIDRLIHYLAHPGYRPAAAVFRALRDLRDWDRASILDHTAGVLKAMEEDGSADRFPEDFMQVDHFYDLTDRSRDEHPLRAPEIWGGIAVYGSGWGSPAGAYVGSAADILNMPELGLERRAIKAQVQKGAFGEALERVEKLLNIVTGAERARLLELKAQLVWRDGETLCPQADLAEALELLADARFTAQAEKDEQLLRNIESTRQKILL